MDELLDEVPGKSWRDSQHSCTKSLLLDIDPKSIHWLSFGRGQESRRNRRSLSAGNLPVRCKKPSKSHEMDQVARSGHACGRLPRYKRETRSHFSILR